MEIQIPGYKINQLIAEGGMAKVYLATQQSLDRQVAIKILSAEQAQHFSKRFMHEGKVIASLSHPNIIVIYDIGIHQSLHYISMEYIPGGNLDEWLQQGLSYQQALDIFKQLLQCLAYIHKQGVVHRDLKPANILFRDNKTPLLTDFGISKQKDVNVNLTQDGTLLGSPYYLSPEQARAQPIDQRSDLYSVGIILFEMLTGEKPFEGPSCVDTIVMHLQSDIPQLPKHLQHLQPFIEKLLAKDKQQRFPSALAALQTLNKLENQFSPCRYTSFRTGCNRLFKTVSQKLSAKYFIFFLSTLLAISASILVLQQLTATTANTDQAILQATQAEPDNLHILSQPETLQAIEPQASIDTQTQQAQIDQLLLQAETAYQADQLTVPKSHNALNLYQSVLALDPNNSIAQQGITNIEQRYVTLIQHHIQQLNYAKAQLYLQRLSQIAPNHPAITSLQQQLREIDSLPERLWKTIIPR